MSEQGGLFRMRAFHAKMYLIEHKDSKDLAIVVTLGFLHHFSIDHSYSDVILQSFCLQTTQVEMRKLD